MPVTSEVAGKIELPVSIETAFEYLSNLENDSLWRKEINQTNMLEKPGLGTRANEYSNLSNRLQNHLLVLHCIEYEPCSKVVYETLSGSPYYLRSSREFQKINDSRCVFLYRVTFDHAIVKKALGFSLPGFLLRFGARKDMNSYLKKLKQII